MVTMNLFINGYERDTVCMHCGRSLVHGIKLSDGRVVGATCLDKKLTKPKIYQGRKYRLGSEKIITAAKVVQFKSADFWPRYGVNKNTISFEAIV